MQKKLFGTDGARGIANISLTPSTVYNIGKALALVYKNKLEKVKIVVGKDNRKSSDMLEASLIAGITAHGGEVELLGVIPSAGVAYLAKHLKAHAGVVISASHNEASYNGVKVFNGNGHKLTLRQELQIEDIVFKEENLLVENSQIGHIKYNKNAIQIYEKSLINNLGGIFNGMSICLDCANGAGGKLAPEIFKKLGLKVKVINDSDDGLLINKNCGATSLDHLIETVKKDKYDVGFALDGDADRLMTVDEQGNIVNGDDIVYIIAKNLKEKNMLNNNTVVGTSMTNYGLEVSLKTLGIELDRSDVGDKYVVEHMLKHGLNFGGEQSGHMVFGNYSTTADGILTAIEILKVIKNASEPFSKLISEVKKFPQILLNVPVEEELKLKIIDSHQLKTELEKSNNIMKDQGRVVVRASGTESLIRVMVEGKDEKLVKDIANNLKNVILMVHKVQNKG